MAWFRQLFGFAEHTGDAAAFAKTKEKFEQRGTSLESKPNGRVFEAGVFSTPSLAELRSQVDLAEARAKMPGALRVSEVIADVSGLHTQAVNKFSFFQAASQFNCLEFVSESVTPERGVTCYCNDPTQGPACATTCAAGTVVRNYFGLDGRGQSRHRQIQNLKDCEELLDNAKNNYFTVVGGYTLSNDHRLSKLSAVLNGDERLREEFRKRLRIGVQWDTEVTGSKFGRMQYEGPQQLVTQAYCSACSVSYSGGSVENWKAFASLVQESLYEATMYAALQNALKHNGSEGSKRVFLTTVGGGVFGNRIDWIVNAMQRAFSIFRGINLEVVIVSFGRSERYMQKLLGDWR